MSETNGGQVEGQSTDERTGLRHWLERNAKLIQLFTAVASALLALVALYGIKVQIDASSRLQAQQSARDIYREFLNLSISKPEFSEPNTQALKASPQWPAYQNYVDYMLYTAEQVLNVTPDWQPVMEEHMAAHHEYLCAMTDLSGYAPQVAKMVGDFQEKECGDAAPSGGKAPAVTSQ